MASALITAQGEGQGSSSGLEWGLLCWSQQCWGCGLGEERGQEPFGPPLGFPVTFQLSFSPP